MEDALLDFLLMPILGVLAAALCVSILFILNYIANGGTSGKYSFDGFSSLVNLPSSTIATDAPRAELIRRRNMQKAQQQLQEDTGLFTPPFVPPSAPYHPRKLTMSHIIKTPPSPNATFLPAVSPTSPARDPLGGAQQQQQQQQHLQRWPLVAMRRAETQDSHEFATTTSPDIPILVQKAIRAAQWSFSRGAPEPVPLIRPPSNGGHQESRSPQPLRRASLPQAPQASPASSPSLIGTSFTATTNPNSSTRSNGASKPSQSHLREGDQSATFIPPAPAPPPPSTTKAEEVDASLAQLIAQAARNRRLVILETDGSLVNGSTVTPSHQQPEAESHMILSTNDYEDQREPRGTNSSIARKRRAEDQHKHANEDDDEVVLQPAKRRVPESLPFFSTSYAPNNLPSSSQHQTPKSPNGGGKAGLSPTVQKKRKPDAVSPRSPTPTSRRSLSNSQPEVKKQRSVQQSKQRSANGQLEQSSTIEKQNLIDRVLATYPSTPAPASDQLPVVAEKVAIKTASLRSTSSSIAASGGSQMSNDRLASSTSVSSGSMGPPSSTTAVSPPPLLLGQPSGLQMDGNSESTRPLSPRGRAPLAANPHERQQMLNLRKRRTVSFDEQQLLLIVNQEEERKKRLMREIEDEELADKRAEKRMAKLLKAATPKKRVQINLETSVIKFDSQAPTSGVTEQDKTVGSDLKVSSSTSSISFDASLFASPSSSSSSSSSLKDDWFSPPPPIGKDSKNQKNRRKRSESSDESSGSSLVSSFDLPSDMPVPLLFSESTSSKTSITSSEGAGISPFDSFLSASSSFSASSDLVPSSISSASSTVASVAKQADSISSLFGPAGEANDKKSTKSSSVSKKREIQPASQLADPFAFLSAPSAEPAASSTAESQPSVSFNPGSIFGPPPVSTVTDSSASGTDFNFGSIFGPSTSSTSSSSSSSSSSRAELRSATKPPILREASSLSFFSGVPGKAKRSPLSKPANKDDRTTDTFAQRSHLLASTEGSAFVNRSPSPSPATSSTSSKSVQASIDFFSNLGSSAKESIPTIFGPSDSVFSFGTTSDEYRGAPADESGQGDEDEDQEDEYAYDEENEEEEDGEEEADGADEEDSEQPEEEGSHNIVYYPPGSAIPPAERIKGRAFHHQGGNQPREASASRYSGRGRGGRGGRGGANTADWGHSEASPADDRRSSNRGGRGSGAPRGSRDRRPRTEGRIAHQADGDDGGYGGRGGRGGQRQRGGQRGGGSRGGRRGGASGSGRGRSRDSSSLPETCPW